MLIYSVMLQARDVQCHLGGHSWRRLSSESDGAHPGLDRVERALNCSRRRRIVSGRSSSRRVTTPMAPLDEVVDIFGTQSAPLSSNEAA